MGRGGTERGAGQGAAGGRGGEFVEVCCGAAGGLPGQIASLCGQGVDVGFVAPGTVFSDGRRGVRDVDTFIHAVNPGGLSRRARVMSPDLPRHPVVYP